MSAVLDSQVDSKYAHRLTRPQKDAIIAACASGIPKQKIAKDFQIRPETVSRILRDVKNVSNPSNPLSHDYKPTLKLKAIEAITRGLEAKRDVYAAANIGVKVMQGIGEFVEAGKVQIEGNVGLTISWQQRSQAQITDAQPLDVVVDHNNDELITGESQ